MSDRENSPAYLAMTPAGRRVLHLINREVERCACCSRQMRTSFTTSALSIFDGEAVVPGEDAAEQAAWT